MICTIDIIEHDRHDCARGLRRVRSPRTERLSAIILGPRRVRESSRYAGAGAQAGPAMARTPGAYYRSRSARVRKRYPGRFARACPRRARACLLREAVMMRERVFTVRERVPARACLALRCQWVPWVWRIGVGPPSRSPHYLPVSTFPGAISIGVSDRLPEGGTFCTLNRYIANMGINRRQGGRECAVRFRGCVGLGVDGTGSGSRQPLTPHLKRGAPQAPLY